MLHFGDITKIRGYDVPIVDVVTFGPPCQDLSVAGKREGMKHVDMGDDETTRSGMFHEVIRIIKEMRYKDARDGRTVEHIRPRFAVYENVYGAFSSNKGQDFQIVLESLAKIVEKDAVIPMPPKNKWTTSGAIVGDGWSIAWRILDAQFWGVPQRRRRIALVADFGGGCAQEVLFVRKGLRRDFEESGTERKSVTTDAQGSIGVHDTDRKVYGFPLGFRPENVCLYDEKATTLCVGTRADFCNGVISIENHPADSRVNIDTSGVVQTLTSRMGTGGGNVPMVMVKDVVGVDAYNQTLTGDKAKALTSCATDSDHIPCVVKAVGCDMYNFAETGDVAESLTTATGQGASNTGPSVIVMDRSAYNQGENAKGPGAVCYVDTSHADDVDRPAICYKKPHYIVRRLTPLECERLQGFPDGWTDIGEYIDSKGKKKKASDSARYKALGNSIALPPWKWVLKRISSHYERDATLASLFDGIGGFPLIWEQINGEGTAIWASEIEDFPIAVTKARIN